jgi:hypothetical protein
MWGLLVLFVALAQFGLMPARLERAVKIQHPSNTVGNAWVVADLTVGADGALQSVHIVEGASPFKAHVLAAVSQWKFIPARTNAPVPYRVSAVFLFRAPDFFSAKSRERAPSMRPNKPDRSALPLILTDPGYPMNSVGVGATTLELQLLDDGSIDSVRTAADEPGLAAWTTQAVRAWKFTPVIRDGIAVPGTVIAVVSYMRPLLAPPYPSGMNPMPVPRAQ